MIGGNGMNGSAGWQKKARMSGCAMLAFAVFVALMACAPGAASAQYFGQNKVNYENFDWHYIKTEHFDIYHPKESFEIAEYAGWTAEDALQKIEASWDYKLKGRIIFIVYPSHNTFQNNNVGGGSPSESTGGFTEFLKNRVVIPYQGSYENFRHVIHHELTHAVMLRMLYGEGVQSIMTGISRMPLPLWFIEGLAEYESNAGWANEADLYIRDAIINDYLMPINRLRGYYIYKGGQSVLYYLHERYGDQKVGDFLKRIRSRRDFNRAVKDALGFDLEELSKRWHKELKSEIWPTAAEYEAPESFATKLTDHEEWMSFINTSPALSPEGDRLVILSDKDQEMALFLINTVTGEIEKKLFSAGRGIFLFEQLLWLRPWIDWSPNGREIAFVAESGPEDVLYTLDVETGKLTREFRFGFDGVFSPSWSPDGTKMVFSGYEDGQSDLYIVDVNDPASVEAITNDSYSDYDPDWGPGGQVLFVSDRGDDLTASSGKKEMWKQEIEQIDVYQIDINNKNIKRITNDSHVDRTPSWTPRKGIVSFVSDRNGAYNLFLKELKTGEDWAISNVLTGAFTPSWSNVGTVAFTSFFEAGYDCYLYKDPFAEDRRRDLKLTYFQQKKRGLLAEKAKIAVDTTDSKEEVIKTFKVGPVESGSADEDSLLAVLDDLARAESVQPDEKTDDRIVEDEAVDSTAVAQPVSAGENGGKLPDDIEDVRFVSGERKRARQEVRPYGEYIFYPYGVEDRQQVVVAEEIPADSLFDESGKFRQRKYKLKFSPDVVYAAAGYNTLFGLQGYGQVMFSDVLGDHVIFLGTDLYYSFENSNFSLYYYNLPHRTDYGGGVFHNVYYFDGGYTRDRNYGASGTVSHPFSRNRRVDLSMNFVNIDRNKWIQSAQDYIDHQKLHFMLPSLAYVFDNTMWGWTSPMKGDRYRLAFTYSPKMSGSYLKGDERGSQWGVDFKTVSMDYRKYWNIGYDYSFAHRLSGATSWGERPQQFFLGGVTNWINRSFAGNGIRDDINDVYFSGFATPMRGANFYERSGNHYLLMNNEFRFPLVRQLLMGWPVPFFFYNIRGVVFMDTGAAWSGSDFSFTTKNNAGERVFDDFVMGYGWGARVDLGIFMLRWDVAWRHELNRVTKPRYYFSLGTDF